MTANDDPKPGTFDAKETIKRYSVSKDPSQITGGRIREISRAKRDGVEIETTPAEDAAYDQFSAAMSGPAAAVLAHSMPNLAPISLAISRVQKTENNIRRLQQEPLTIRDKMKSISPDEMDLSHLEVEKQERAEKKSAEKDRRRELEDQHVELAAGQRDLLTLLLETTTAERIAAAARDADHTRADIERTKADAAMTKHQKRMNRWIFGATVAGIFTAIGIKVFGG